MTLLTPEDIERIKESARKLQGLRLVGGPVDDIGPYDFNIIDTTPMTQEEKEKFMNELREAVDRLKKENVNGNIDKEPNR